MPRAWGGSHLQESKWGNFQAVDDFARLGLLVRRYFETKFRDSLSCLVSLRVDHDHDE